MHTRVRHTFNAFLSTPSARRATGTSTTRWSRTDISIHALREEGDLIVNGFCDDLRISIHALREEGDAGQAVPALDGHGFLSTPSARRAT